MLFLIHSFEREKKITKNKDLKSFLWKKKKDVVVLVVALRAGAG